MKNQKIILAAALLALGVASCQKEEKIITHFTAGMEQSEAKTYLGVDNYFYWESTDKVKVYSDASNAGADFTVVPRSGNATWADLAGSITKGSSYKAIYPASIATSAVKVNLPAVQTSADGSLAGFPMYAESSSTEFQFKNLCGALKIHLQQTGCTISRIKVTAGSTINGTYAVSVTDGTPSLAYSANGTNSVMLTLGTAQSIADGHDFYIYLPADEYSDMQLTFYQPDGSYCTKSGSVTVKRSVCTPVTINGSLTFIPEGSLPGLFSVSNNKQVIFASGNLQYVNGAWHFAEHQYDCLGTYSTDAWDLFGWSIDNSFGMNTAMNSSNSGTFVDWGTAINPNGGDTPWRTLSNDEWSYLIGRSGKYGLATITDVYYPGTNTLVTGLVLLPDNWTSSQSFNAGRGSGFSTNLYTAAQWAQMEAAGAVFLPAAGNRVTTGMYNVGTIGYYWSSTPDGGIYAFGMGFFDNSVYCHNNGRGNGFSVRLVQDNN